MKAVDSKSVDYINAYCRSSLGGILRCELDSVKGRILSAGRSFEPGTRIIVEPPLVLVAEAPEDATFARLRRLARQRDFAHAPLWYWSAMCSLTEEDAVECDGHIPTASLEQQTRLLLLCHPSSGAEDASTDVAQLVDEFFPRASAKRAIAAKLDRLLVVWLLNCFEHSEEPQGFSTFFIPSFLSHSCRPNCMWHYDGDDFVLRARERIEAGDEVTVSYLSEEALLESTASRRGHLEATKHFTCYCERCVAVLDTVRGFACPACNDGVLFLDTSSASPVASERGACRRCGFVPDTTQIGLLCAQEARVEQFVQEWDRKAGRAGPDMYLTDTLALRLETNLAGLLSARHWLRDRCSRHLVTYYEAIGRADLALPLAKQCVQFIVDSYPGCSALHAWALETEGDLVLRLEGFHLPGPSSVEAPQAAPAERLTRAWREVSPIYKKAAQILGLLFGESHDFYETMKCKVDALALATHAT